jgi:hypothetical protein
MTAIIFSIRFENHGAGMNAKFVRIVFCLMSLGFFVGASKSFAQPSSTAADNYIYYAPANPPKEHAFELSQEDGYTSYKENGRLKKTGGFYGLNAVYTYQPSAADDWMINIFHVDMHGDYGSLKYNYYQHGQINNANNYVAEPRIWIGKYLKINPFLDITPYAGFGYRWEFDQLHNEISDGSYDGGSHVQNQYFYVPVGAQAGIHPADGWHLVLNGEYDFLAWDENTNYAYSFGSGISATDAPKYSLHTRQGYGIRGSIKIVKEGDVVNYFVEPYIRYWYIKLPDTVTYGQGVQAVTVQYTKNSTTEIGARLGVEF